jgi:hypothetical protein
MRDYSAEDRRARERLERSSPKGEGRAGLERIVAMAAIDAIARRDVATTFDALRRAAQVTRSSDVAPVASGQARSRRTVPTDPEHFEPGIKAPRPQRTASELDALVARYQAELTASRRERFVTPVSARGNVSGRGADYR